MINLKIDEEDQPIPENSALVKWKQIEPNWPNDEYCGFINEGNIYFWGSVAKELFLRNREAAKHKEGELLESELEMSYFNELLKTNKSARRQVQTRCGTIDILTDNAIYEIKLNLTRDSILKAIGQLLVCNLEMPRGKLYIVGRKRDEPNPLIEYAEQLNIGVIEYNVTKER